MFLSKKKLDSISIDTNGTILNCAVNLIIDPNRFLCSFILPIGGDGTAITSTFFLSSLEVLLFLFLVDPLVVQLPDSVSNVRGTFDHPAVNGSLFVDGPLNSVDIDRNRSLTAEPGTSLYVIALPESAHADVADINGVIRNPNPADVDFNLQFDAPLNVTSISAKVIVAAHARTVGGEDFYLTLFPCVSSIAAVPALTVPIPVPGNSDTIDLSIAASVSGCSDETFDVGGIAPSSTSPITIPLLGPWGLTGLVFVLGALAG